MTQELHPLAELVEPLRSDPPPPPGAPGHPAEAPLPRQPRLIRWPRISFRVPQTLTGRLVASVVALVVVIVGITGTATYYQLHSFMYTRLDLQVNQQADSTAGSIARSSAMAGCDPSTESCKISGGRPFGGGPVTQQWIVLLSASGDVRSTVTANTDIKALNLSSGVRLELVNGGREPQTVTTTDGHTVRVTVRPANGYLIVSGIATSEVDRILHRLLLLELAIGGTGIVLALVLTALGMNLGLRPLKRVTRTAQEVTAELSPEGAGLDRRVPGSSSTTEVGQLATSFNTMLDTVETEFKARRESEERMRQFLADASHELRTPLTSIRGYAELERMQRARSGDTGGGDAITRIEAEGTRMSRLVEDLLILARGDDAANDGVVERASVDVADVVADVVSDVRAAHPDRTIIAAVDPGLGVFADRDQVLRLLRNLATNAAVHTDPGGSIRIEGHREGASVVLQVIDQGPGLSPDEAAHVFERFWRADKARTRVRGGSGLGMAIVAQIVEAHSGQVYFDSSVSHGSTVTVVLPGGVG